MRELSRDLDAVSIGVSMPRYDPRSVTSAIVHIGLGAHFAKYTHDLMNDAPDALGWGIVGAGLRRTDSNLLATLHRQQGLYTLVETDLSVETKTLIGSILDALDASESSNALLTEIDRPTTRIVSITVSEHGYHLASASRTLNLADTAILQDIAHPRKPQTMPGILVEGLRRRRQAGRPAFTVMSCDNIQHNGSVLRETVLALAAASDETLADWIAVHGRFPSSMVDRITPVPTPERISKCAATTGLSDDASLFTETFRQWVIEDNFADGRPDWDRVGAQFVSDVGPYEAMKLRLLNASHLAIASIGVLGGHDSVLEAINDPLIARYMVRLMDEETGPTLLPVPGIDLATYKSTLIDRFANPAIHDPLSRINADAPVNLLLDPIRDRLAASASIDLLALGLAAWLVRVRDDVRAWPAGRPMQQAEALLQDAVRCSNLHLVDLLAVEEAFGPVGRDPRLVANVGQCLRAIDEQGVHGTLKHAIEA
jgi:mannitol 2-dehydrogenase